MIKIKNIIKIYKIHNLISTGFGIGALPNMQGTIGSIVALIFWKFFLSTLSFSHYLFLLISIVLLGTYVCDKTEKDIKIHDHSCIVFDEFIGMWISLTNLHSKNLFWICLSFCIFRILDIYKPWPICWFDKNIPGGIGVLIDDIIAGTITTFIIYILKFIVVNYLKLFIIL